MIGRGTPIELDRLRHLRYDSNAIADLEELLGEGFAALMSGTRQIGVRHARAFLWAGLKHEDRLLLNSRTGIEKVGQMIDAWYADGRTLDGLYLEIFSALKADGWLRPARPGQQEEVEGKLGELMGDRKESPDS